MVTLFNNYYVDNNSSLMNFQVRNAPPNTPTGNIQRGYVGVVSKTGGAAVYTPSMVFGLQTGASSYSEQMRLDSSGNMGVGTPTPGYKLDVNGDINIAAANAIRFGGTQVCTSSGCTSTSDGRLKENILPLSHSLSNLLKLQGMSYEWKDKEHFGSGPQIGLIAQEVEKVYPEVVVTDRRTGLKSMAYDHLVAPLIEALKELFNQIQTMNAQDIERDQNLAAQNLRLKSLEQENAMLKDRLEKLEKVLQSQ